MRGVAFHDIHLQPAIVRVFSLAAYLSAALLGGRENVLIPSRSQLLETQAMDIQTQAESILRSWAQQFHECGDFDDGIKIVHDGFLTDDDGNEDEDQPCYAIFVHRDSLSGQFPEHDSHGGLVVHRPSEEVCFYVWLDLDSGQDQEINEPNTALDLNDFYRMIIEIQSKYEDQ